MLAWLVSKYIKQVDNKTVDIVVVVPCGTVLLEWKMPVVAFSNYINAILSSHLVSLYISYFPFGLMHYLFLPSLLAALVLPLSVIAAQLCDAQKRPVVASAWYEGWAAQNITPAMIPMNLLNRVIVAFALVSFLLPPLLVVSDWKLYAEPQQMTLLLWSPSMQKLWRRWRKSFNLQRKM